jgi:hypothetical protein
MTAFISLTAKLIVSAVWYDKVTSCDCELPRNLLSKEFNWKVEHVSRINKNGLKLMRRHRIEKCDPHSLVNRNIYQKTFPVMRVETHLLD